MSKKEKYLIEKSNTLNGMQTTNMGLTELRFFLMYISKLNARNINNRTVSINIKDFEELFGVSFNTSRFTEKILQIMSRTITVYSNDEKIILSLYSEFRWKKGNTKTLQITCNDKMLPYLFELKSNYTSYIISNIAKLNSVAKIRLYEIMKQYEKLETVKIELERLQKMMDCENSIFKYFKKDVLEPAIKDINKYTDIQVSYEKNLACRKVVALTFTISKKDDAPKFLPDSVENSINNFIESLYYRCNESYSIEQLKALYNYVESSGIKLNTSVENYIYSVYCKIKIKGNIINNLFKYTFAIIEKQVNDYIFNVQSVQREEIKNKKSKKESGFDLEEWKKIVNSTPRRMSNEECFFVLDDFDNIIGYVFASDFDKITNETWRILRNNFKNGHLSSKSDLGRNLLDLKK